MARTGYDPDNEYVEVYTTLGKRMLALQEALSGLVKPTGNNDGTDYVRVLLMKELIEAHKLRDLALTKMKLMDIHNKRVRESK